MAILRELTTFLALKYNDKLLLAMNKQRIDYVNNLWIKLRWITHFMVKWSSWISIYIKSNAPI